MHYVAHRSVPKVLVTDGGREFTNQVLNELSALLGMDRAVTAAYHPQSNSTSESYNRTFYKYMRQSLDLKSTLDWEESLPGLSLCYNTAVHRATLQTPFFLTYLHHPNMPCFDMDVPETKYSDSWATERYLDMQQSFRLAKQNNEEASRKMKEAFDKKTTDRSLQIGDTVMVRFPTNVPIPGNKEKTGNPKMQQEWRPDYSVIEQLGPYTYKVQHGPHARPTKVNIDRLQLQRSGNVTQPPPETRPAARAPAPQPAEPAPAQQQAEQPVRRGRGRPRKQQQQQLPVSPPPQKKRKQELPVQEAARRITRSMTHRAAPIIVIKKKERKTHHHSNVCRPSGGRRRRRSHQ